MVSSTIEVKEVRRLIAVIVLLTTVLSSCQPTKKHTVPKPRVVATAPQTRGAAKSVIEKQTRSSRRSHTLRTPQSVQPAHSEPTFTRPQQNVQPFTQPRKLEPAPILKPLEPVPVQPDVEVSSEFNDLPKIEKVEPLTQKPKTKPSDNPDNDVFVSANNATRIIDAQGRRVVVTGSDGLILITGGSDQLTVKGDSNQIQCDIATDILVTGNKNTIVLDKFGGGEVSGSSNKITWEQGLIGGFNPIVNNTGSENSIGDN